MKSLRDAIDEGVMSWNEEARISCRFRFKCPQVWDRLQPTDVEGVRHCPECRRDVHLALTEEAFSEAQRRGPLQRRACWCCPIGRLIRTCRSIGSANQSDRTTACLELNALGAGGLSKRCDTDDQSGMPSDDEDKSRLSAVSDFRTASLLCAVRAICSARTHPANQAEWSGNASISSRTQ